jgi:hypothetical protein
MQSEYGVLTTDIKKKILGLNAARLYDLKVPEGRGLSVPAEPTAGEAVGAGPVPVSGE